MPQATQFELGRVGLGTMGMNLLLNLADRGSVAAGLRPLFESAAARAGVRVCIVEAAGTHGGASALSSGEIYVGGGGGTSRRAAPRWWSMQRVGSAASLRVPAGTRCSCAPSAV